MWRSSWLSSPLITERLKEEGPLLLWGRREDFNKGGLGVTGGKAQGPPSGFVIVLGFSDLLLTQARTWSQVSVHWLRLGLLPWGRVLEGLVSFWKGLLALRNAPVTPSDEELHRPSPLLGSAGFYTHKLLRDTQLLIIGNGLISAQRQHCASHVFILPSPNSMIFNFHHTLKQPTSKTHIINM